MTRLRVATIFFMLLLAVTSVQAQAEQDIKGGQDHPLISRMPGFYLDSYDVKDFDSYSSAYVQGKDSRWEGKLTKLGYYKKEGTKPVSMLQIVRNYDASIKKISGKILYSGDRAMAAKIQKNGALTYVEVSAFNDGRNYELVIVETKPMEQEVVADAAALKKGIAATGKVAVYGIFFDTAKSDIKPESDPALNEITKLLKQNPRLNIYVVGHTDGAGVLESNLKLSAGRADAVVKALTSRGIAAARLKPAGVGPYCPVDTNRTEEGKVKNRRVELVERN
jgi:outer membrane protein OmpA-like peptidoglycan-associated protein